MSVSHYEESGEIDYNTPLEPFYEAMLPRLKSYGFTEEFPPDKLSTLGGGLAGYEYDILIGASPGTFRYYNSMPGGYSTYPDELRKLESVGLSHLVTGEELFIRVMISGYPGERLQITLELKGAESEIEAFRKAFAPILTKYKFESKSVEQTNRI